MEPIQARGEPVQPERAWGQAPQVEVWVLPPLAVHGTQPGAEPGKAGVEVFVAAGVEAQPA